MCFRSQVSGFFFFLTVLVLCLSSSLALDLGKTSQLSSFKSLGRRNDMPITDHTQNFHKPNKNKMKTIHRRTTQYQNKDKINKPCATRHDHKKSHNLKSETQSKDNTNYGKQKYIPPPQSQAVDSILHVTSDCGSAQPTRSITTTSGPNGNESFLNCGITGHGWKPPNVTMSMITRLSLDQEPAKQTFAPCEKYRQLFEKHGKAYGIPPIFLAAFAMQESNCNPDSIGDQGAAVGLMQITKEKCGGAPEGNCAHPDFNIGKGAQTFASGLSEANGNVLQAIGAYNGWTVGLTEAKAKEAIRQGCCVCQQNLDYLHHFLNAWILGQDPQKLRLGSFRNLDACG